MTRIRIGTRGSQLALWQANEVRRKLLESGFRPEIITVKTSGDKHSDVPLAAVGGKGLFIKELEEALDRGAIDMAVHSLKDVPSMIAERFTLAGFLERADPRDAWIQLDHLLIAHLPAGSVVGTSSPRRRAQILHRFSQLKVETIRGNVETRIAKARAGLYAGVVLATAGLVRLGRESEITSQFSVEDMVPAAGQGIVVIETMSANIATREAARSINHAPTEQAALLERGVLQKFGQQLDCYSAVAVHATTGTTTTIRAFLSDYDATRAIRVTQSGSDPQKLIGSVYEELIARGAMELLVARR